MERASRPRTDGPPRRKEPLVQTTVQLEPRQLALLDRRADAEGLRRSHLIRRAIDRYLGLRAPAVPTEVSS